MRWIPFVLLLKSAPAPGKSCNHGMPPRLPEVWSLNRPPKAIVSPDGNVYLHWEFYRDPQYACSTYFAHPKMLRAAPNGVSPSKPPAPGPFGPEENPIPSGEGQREGNLRGLSPRDASRQLAAADKAD